MASGNGGRRSDPWSRGLRVAVLVFFTAAGISWLSQKAMSDLHVALALPLLLLIVGVGVAFDMLGTAVTAAEEPPFHARAAKKLPGTRHSLWLIRNAAAVANFSNDIVGDIAGTIGGAAAATIAVQVALWLGGDRGPGAWQELSTIVAVGLVASLTIGGKALGKEIALRRPGDVVWFVGRLLDWFERTTGVTVVPRNRARR